MRQTPLFSQLFLCLSRACLGKLMHFLMYKWRKKWRFAHQGNVPLNVTRIRRPTRAHARTKNQRRSITEECVRSTMWSAMKSVTTGYLTVLAPP